MSAREVAEYLVGRNDPRQVADYVLRTRTPDGLDVLAYGASQGLLNYEQLTSQLDSPSIDKRWLAELGRTVALWNEPNSRYETARTILEAAIAESGSAALPEDLRVIYAQLLVRTGRFATAARLRRSVSLPQIDAWTLDVDIANPISGAGKSTEPWLRRLNAIFTCSNLEPVSLSGSVHGQFARLESPRVAGPHGPVVSVIMPCHDPDETIVTSVMSILNQSWVDLELIIVDDASSEEGRQRIDEVAALDPRARVVRFDVNSGTYAARNAGIEVATGTFVTFQDADDWSHPRRIELQVRQLQAHPTALATQSWAVRAYPDLTFTFVGYPTNRINASSLLYRREQVENLIGRFDDARKSGDVEFSARLAAAAPGSIVWLDESLTLAITQVRSGSLSRADSVPGWFRWDRIAYRNAYQQWHREIKAGQSDPTAISAKKRPFPLPSRSWQRRRESSNGRADPYDLLVLSDWRTGQGPQPDAIRDVLAARRLGLRVALAAVEAPVPAARRRQAIQPAVQQIINDGTVAFHSLEEPLSVGTVLILNLDSLLFMPVTPVRVETDRVLLAAAAIPSDTTLRAADEHAGIAFGRTPQWIPRDRLAQQTLARIGAERLNEMLPYDLTRFDYVRHTRIPTRPVVGRPAYDHPILWPETIGEVLSAYPDDDEFDVRILGEATSALRVLRSKAVPPNWTVFGSGQLPWHAYISGLDFFVYAPHRNARKDAHALILDALSAGCIAILPPRLASLYGDAALYCTPGEVPDMIRTIRRDEAGYAEQRQRALAYVHAYPSFADVGAALLAAERLSAIK